jgi:hypothetical protein
LEETIATEQEIRELKHCHSARLLSEPGVSGVGIEKDDTGAYVLAVHLDSDEAAARLPEEIDGHPVKYIKSGPFRKLPATDKPE